MFIDYETSFEKAFTYNYPWLDFIEKNIWCFTLTIRFARCRMLEEETREFVKKSIHFLNLKKILFQQNFLPIY